MDGRILPYDKSLSLKSFVVSKITSSIAQYGSMGLESTLMYKRIVITSTLHRYFKMISVILYAVGCINFCWKLNDSILVLVNISNLHLETKFNYQEKYTEIERISLVFLLNSVG